MVELFGLMQSFDINYGIVNYFCICGVGIPFGDIGHTVTACY